MRKYILVLLCLLFSNVAQELKAQKQPDTLILGGAFRYTYMYNSWNSDHKKTGGKAIFDAFIMNAKGSYKGIEFAMENRYYAESFGGFMIRNGYVGLPLGKKLKLKVGMPQTPFGITPYTGNSFMFNMQYYLGFEDDADIGLVLDYNLNNVEAQVAFAKNAEDIFSQGNRRYAYDINGDNKELNQFTGRIAWFPNENKEIEFGISGLFGELYNSVSEEKGSRFAGAIHGVWKRENLDIKAEFMAYEFNPDDPENLGYIEMGAFASNYQVANEGLLYSISVSYKVNTNHVLLNDIKFYNDFSALYKSKEAFDNSYMNVTGCMIHTGPIYVLIDYVIANNHPWISANYSGALSSGGEEIWNKRFNINLGIYF